jgi:excisionase family DNA binding protein
VRQRKVTGCWLSGYPVSLAAMKEQHQSKGETVTITFSGELVVNRAVVEELLQMAPATLATPVVSQPAALAGGRPEGLPRLAYTMQETAKILGVSYITVYRLMQRGLLRGSSAVRTKLIPRREIERFLEKTMPRC